MVRDTRATTHPTPNQPAVADELTAFALAYAEAGWPVFPLTASGQPAFPNHHPNNCNRSDPRCAGPAGHQGWEQRATTNPDRITQAWNHRPWGIGIACGPARLVVIDLDNQPGAGVTGAESLRQLETDYDQTLPAPFAVATPTGGRHLYYQQPPNTTVESATGVVAPGININATGRYVPAPPTTTTTGAYHVIDDTWPPPLPDWFTDLLQATTAHLGEAIPVVAAGPDRLWPPPGAPFQPPPGEPVNPDIAAAWARWTPADWARLPDEMRANAPWWIPPQIERWHNAQAQTLEQQLRAERCERTLALHGTTHTDPTTTAAFLNRPLTTTAKATTQ